MLTRQWMIVGFGVMCLVAAALLLRGRGKWLLIGYSTLSKREKARYDEKVLRRTMGFFSLFVSAMTFLALLADRCPWLQWVFPVAIIGAAVCAMNFLNKNGRPWK